MKVISLNGKWEFQEKQNGKWRPAIVPGCVHTDLMKTGCIPDPFYGTNELDITWVGTKDWTYRKKFMVSKNTLETNKNCHLICEGIDTVANILINGHNIGRTDNMFRRYVFKLEKLLKPGLNEIEIEFTSPHEYGRFMSESYPHECRGSEYHWPLGQDMDATNRNFLRKQQCQFGWDWAPYVPTVGIWRDINISFSSSPLIQYLVPEQKFNGDDVELKIDLYLLSEFQSKFDIKISLFNGTDNIHSNNIKELRHNGSGIEQFNFSLNIKSPKLWYPNGYGKQTLYNLEVMVFFEGEKCDRKNVNIGFRKLKLVREADLHGESFYFEVNNIPIFAKGANWVPPDPFPSRIEDSRYQRLISMVKKSNMNMLRVWGGGIYEKDIFYELCDEFGILVWQDFMFACCSYPADQYFLTNVTAEVNHQVRRLKHHASIALWCGNNENSRVAEVWSKDENHSKLLQKDYDALQKTLKTILKKEDNERSFLPSSPYPESDNKSGDSHVWDMDSNKGEFNQYEVPSSRFVSEFGFQSFPNIKTLRCWIPEMELNPASASMDHHQRKKGGTGVLLDFIYRNFRFPLNMEWLCHLSQLSQALALKTAVEEWRRQKDITMGTLYWQLADTWPAVSWAAIDCNLVPKALYYFTYRFFSPLLLSFKTNGTNLELWLTSDLTSLLEDYVVLDIWSTTNGLVHSERIKFKSGCLQSACIHKYSLESISKLGIPKEEIILHCHLDINGLKSSNCHFMVPFKYLNLLKPKFIWSQNKNNSFSISCNVPAPFVWIEELDNPSPVEFSNNFFHLFPGEELDIEIPMEHDLTEKSTFTIRSLYDNLSP